MVWAIPFPLATTHGITFVFSSSGYLDVSVPRVCLILKNDAISSIWQVAPFGNLRIVSYVPIPAAYRSLSHPSSPLRAKASTMHSCLLLTVYVKISHFYRLDFIYLNSYVKEHLNLVENIGLEPMTSCVQNRRSSQLS